MNSKGIKRLVILVLVLFILVGTFVFSRYWSKKNRYLAESSLIISNTQYISQFPIPFHQEPGAYFLQCMAKEIVFSPFVIDTSTVVHAYTPCSYLNKNKEIETAIIPLAIGITRNQDETTWIFMGGKNKTRLYENKSFTKTEIINIIQLKFGTISTTELIITLTTPQLYILNDETTRLLLNTSVAISEDRFKKFSEHGELNSIAEKKHQGYTILLPAKVSLK